MRATPSLATQPVVQVRDAQGNLRTGDSSTQVTVAIQSGAGGTLGGTTAVTAVNGVATFSGVTLAGTVGTNYVLRFSSGSLMAADSSDVTVTPGAAAQLAITTQPAGAASGTALATQPVVQVRDAQGNLRTGDSTTQVTVAIQSGAGGTLGGTTTVTAASGVATFSGVTLAGTVGTNYVLRFSSGSLTTADSGNVTVTTGAAAATTSTVSADPTTLTADGLSTSALTVQLKDAQGNNLTTGGATVTFGTPSSGSIGTVTDNGNGTYSATFTVGVQAATVVITPKLTGTNFTNTVTLTLNPGIPSAATSTVSASPASLTANGTSTSTLTVQLKDANGIDIRTGGATVTFAALSSGQGSIGPVTDNGNGTYSATYTAGTVAAPVTVRPSVDGTAFANTATVTLVPGAVSAGANGSLLSGTDISRVADGVEAATVSVQLRDVYGNDVPQPGVTVSFATTRGTLSAASAQTNASGLASVTLTSTQSGSASVTASVASVGAVTNGSPVMVGFSPGAATRLAITTQPVAGVSGALLLTQPVVRIVDAQGNVVTGDSATTVSVAIQSGTGGALGGTTTVTSSNGVATFANLALTGTVGESYVLRFSAGALATVDAAPISPCPPLVFYADTDGDGYGAGAPLGTYCSDALASAANGGVPVSLNALDPNDADPSINPATLLARLNSATTPEQVTAVLVDAGFTSDPAYQALDAEYQALVIADILANLPVGGYGSLDDVQELFDALVNYRGAEQAVFAAPPLDDGDFDAGPPTGRMVAAREARAALPAGIVLTDGAPTVEQYDAAIAAYDGLTEEAQRQALIGTLNALRSATGGVAVPGAMSQLLDTAVEVAGSFGDVTQDPANPSSATVTINDAYDTEIYVQADSGTYTGEGIFAGINAPDTGNADGAVYAVVVLTDVVAVPVTPEVTASLESLLGPGYGISGDTVPTPLLGFSLVPELRVEGTVDAATLAAFRAEADAVFAAATHRVDLSVPPAVYNAYFKYDAASSQWIRFDYSATDGLGATFIDSDGDGLVETVRLFLRDNARGDSDPAVGSISDPGFGARADGLDTDGDGAPDVIDCAPSNPQVYPGAMETIGDGIDSDCDGKDLCYRDGDDDGYLVDAPLVTLSDLPAPAGGSCTRPHEGRPGDPRGDCDDASAATFPGAVELCADRGTDNDCDGDRYDSSDERIFYFDADGDRVGVADISVSACVAPAGYVLVAGDGCPDNPFAFAPVAWYRDADGDLFGSPSVVIVACVQPAGHIPKINTDCDDSNPAINPNGVEVCDAANADEDCDGLRDDADPSVLPAGKSSFYVDTDNDNYGAGPAASFCDEPALYAPVAGDCDNSNAAVNPGAAEACDLVDNNCNGQNNEGLAFSLWYVDADSDLYGAGDGYSWCASTPARPRSNNLDCDDANPAVRPGAAETCDGIDNNCASGIDEGFPNFDGDSYADCVDPDIDNDGSLNAPDCNDFDASIRPGAAEVCDGYDNDCDSYVDDADPSVTGRPRWYSDTDDSDGYGDPAQFLDRCIQPSGYVANDSDQCPTVAGRLPRTWYRDQDIDGQGDPAQSTQACTAPTGYVDNNTDLCPQTQGVFAPQAFYRDQDGDGFGDPAQTQSACSAPEGYVGNSGDGCPDVYALQAPRLWYRDQDGDGAGDGAQSQSACAAPAGYVGNSSDGCPDVYALQAPVSYFIDVDRDGYGGGATALLCATPAPDGYSSLSGDCDDAVAGLVSPIRYYLDGDGDGAGAPASFVDLCQKAPPPSYVTNANDLCDGDAYKTEPGVCGCGVSDADSDGDGVSDCIDTTPALRLVPRSGGQFIGSPIVIDVTVDTQIEPSVGAQLALRFDTSKLAFVSMAPGGGPVFEREVIEMVNHSAGTILYAVGETTSGGGSTASATVATITFRLVEGVDEVCGTQNLVTFGSVAGSTSRLASPSGSLIVPTLLGLGPVTASASPVGLIDVPDSWSRPADAGVMGSVFAQPPVTANVPCGSDPSVTLSVAYPAGHSPATGTSWPAGGIFPVGTTTVTWTAPATGGGAGFSAVRQFTVLDHALMNVTVSLPGTIVSAHERTMQVKVGSGAWVASGPVTIAPYGSGTDVQGRGTFAMQVPVGTTASSCVLVRDPAHTVARAGNPSLSGTSWSLAATVVQGDSNADNRVDILDYAIFLLDQVGTPVARSARSNFNGDTFVNNVDFSFISRGFFTIGDTCDEGGTSSGGALERISVAELRKRGDGELAVADLNRDGWVDLDDIALWMQGVRPELEAGDVQSVGNVAE